MMNRRRVTYFVLGLAAVVLVAAAAPLVKADDEKRVGDPYPLATCPVSGKALGSMGAPIVVVKDGQELRFCCDGCPKKLDSDGAAVLKKVNDQIIAQQKDMYPLDTCIASGEKLGKDAVDFVYGNRLFRLCCKDCETDIRKDPAKYFGLLDKAVEEKQGPTYALKTCPVSGKPIEGKGVERVVAGRLVRFCCAGCPVKFENDPAKYLSMLDKPSETAKK
jgi:YHS domain-containing protein